MVAGGAVFVEDGGYVGIGHLRAQERSYYASERQSAQPHEKPPNGSVVGTGRFELPTCRLGGDRSIHLSYVPANLFIIALHRGSLLQAFPADVGAVVHAVEVNQPRRGVAVLDGGRKVGAGGGNPEDPSARGFESAGPLPRAGVKDGGARGLALRGFRVSAYRR